MPATKDRALKIATWNVMRPRVRSKRTPNILNQLKVIDADILVLTETNDFINPGEQYSSFSTADLYGSLSKFGEPYRNGEKRVTIWVKDGANAVEHTCVSESGVCIRLDGLTVYGNVIGPYGRGGIEFYDDLKNQIEDWERLSELGHLCILGDFNTTFNGRYFTKEAREKLDACFEKLRLEVRTRQVADNIDHIAISKDFVASFSPKTHEWNTKRDKSNFSDHMGVCLTLEGRPS